MMTLQRSILKAVLLVPLVANVTACNRSAGTAGNSAPSGSIAEFVPPSDVEVQVMELAAPPRLDTLTQQFQNAIRRDPAWMQEYVREVNAPPGEPLPYHPNFGLSEEEYQEMQSLFEEMTLVPSREAVLSVTELEGNRFRLDGGANLVGLSEIVIDADDATVSTPFGALHDVQSVSPNSEQTITGSWTGFSWRHEDVDSEAGAGTTINFDIGRLVDSGDGLLYFDARRMEGGELVDRTKWTLTYPLAQ